MLVLSVSLGVLVIYHEAAWKTLCQIMARKSIAQRDLELAKTWLERAEIFAAPDAETALMLCGLARRTGNAEQFESMLASAETHGASAFDLQRERLLFAAAAGQMRLAEPQLARLLQAEGYDNVDVSRAFINGYLRNQRLHRALPLIEAWIKDVPTDPEPWYIRGQIRRQRSEFVEAASDLREALRIDADYYEAGLSLASVDLKLGRFQTAEAELLRVTARLGQRPESQMLLAECYTAQQKSEEARRILDSLLDADPKHLDALLLCAQLDVDEKQYAAALEKVDRLLSAQPRKSKARYLRATILRKLDRVGESDGEMKLVANALNAEAELQVLQQQISKTPEDPELLVKAAVLLLQVMEDNRQAIFALQAAIDLQPDHRNALRMLADLYDQSAVESERELGRRYRERLSRLVEHP